MKTFLSGVVFILAFFTVVLVFADEITLEATVNDTTVELGSSLKLTVTINGADSIPSLQLAKIDGLETRYLGPATRISIINGKMLRSTGLMFTLIPLRTGQFQIPAITIQINGKDYTTTPINISVVNPGKSTSGQQNAVDKNSPASLQDKIFIILGTSKKEVYVNETISLVVKLFINELAVKNVQYPVYEHEGFSAEDFGEPRRGQQNLGGINYQAMEFRTLIYPTRTGELSLGPAKLGANILIKNSHREDIPSQFNDIFSDDLFDNFLGRFETKTIMLESPKIGINVLPLPQEGKPADFSGGVGKYNFEMTVSPATVKVGDPLTVRMRVVGDGNLKSVDMPVLRDSKDFKIYEPKITQQNGEKVLEQVVIPNHDKITELPAMRFSYFDPTDKQYHSVIQGPFSLMVSPLAKGEETKIVGITGGNVAAAPPVSGEELGQDIHFIKEDPGHLQKRGYVLYRDGWLVVGLIFYSLGWAGFLINYEFKKRLMTDIRLARRLHAPRQARDGLAQAGRFLHEKDIRNFYDSIFKTLQEYLGNKFHLAAGAIKVEDIRGYLKSKDCNHAALVFLQEVFNECELVRFASAQVPEDKMKKTFARAQEIIDFFERNYK